MTVADAAAAETVTESQLANAIRALAMDAVEAAKSGHPGMPMGMAEIAAGAVAAALRYNPAHPRWPDRDRFVLVQRSRFDAAVRAAAPDRLRPADGGAQALSATGLEDAGASGGGGDARAWRPPPGRWARGSPTRWGWRSPSGCWRPQFNRPGHAIVDHHTYVFAGDGCLMEGISHEACSLAGTLGLGKLIVCLRRQRDLDRRRDARTGSPTTRPRRFEAYGWHVHARRGRPRRRRRSARRSRAAQADGAQQARRVVCCKTMIGKGAPTKAGTRRQRTARRWARRKSRPPARRSAGRIRRSRFREAIYDGLECARRAARALGSDWATRFAAYRAAYPRARSGVQPPDGGRAAG